MCVIIPVEYSREIEMLKFIWNHRRPWIDQVILTKRSKYGSMVRLDLNYSTRQCDTSINIDTDQRNRIEPCINPRIYRQVILNKGTKNTREKKVSSINKVLKKWKICLQRVKLESYLTSYSKKWIQDFKMRPEIIKFLEENIGESSLSLVMAVFCVFLFLIWQQKHRQEKEKSVGPHQIKKIL